VPGLVLISRRVLGGWPGGRTPMTDEVDLLTLQQTVAVQGRIIDGLKNTITTLEATVDSLKDVERKNQIIIDKQQQLIQLLELQLAMNEPRN
jgi:hypothetical protein